MQDNPTPAPGSTSRRLKPRPFDAARRGGSGSRWRPRASLKTYLLALVLLAVLPLAALLTYRTWQELHASRLRLEEQLGRNAATAARIVDGELASSFDALASLGRSEALQAGHVQELEKSLREQPQIRRQWRNVFVANDRGELLFDTAFRRDEPVVRAEDTSGLVAQVLQGRQPMVSDLAWFAPWNSFTVLLALPAGGYVIGTRIEVGVLQRLLESAHPLQGGFLSLFDGQHRLMVHTRAPPGLRGARLAPHAVQMLETGSAGAMRATLIAGEDSIAAWSRLGRWRVAAGLPARPVKDAETLLLLWAFAAVGLCLLLGVGVAFLAARRVARPLQAKDEFLAMLSHELRSPLGAIAAAADVLETHAGGPETAEKALAIIQHQTRRLSYMANDLLDVSRVATGKVLLSPAAMDLAEVVRRLKNTLDLTGENHRHVLRLELQSVWIDGDFNRIEQIVGNLLTNAFKYTQPGGLVTVSVRPEGSHALLVVRDTGMGIPPSLLPHVFEPFVQDERVRDRSEGGLGIGLALVRKLVELHGGRVDVESTEAGSAFTVRFPAVPAPGKQLASVAGRLAQRLHIVLVEDKDDVRESMGFMLVQAGHRVTAVRSGAEGLASIARLRPDVAIVDVELPGLGGHGLARAARSQGYPGRMIAISGHGRPEDIESARKSGFDACLVKPVDAEALRSSLWDPP